MLYSSNSHNHKCSCCYIHILVIYFFQLLWIFLVRCAFRKILFSMGFTALCMHWTEHCLLLPVCLCFYWYLLSWFQSLKNTSAQWIHDIWKKVGTVCTGKNYLCWTLHQIPYIVPLEWLININSILLLW